MSEYAGFIQSPDAPFKNSNNYIDIGPILAPFADPDRLARRAAPHD